MGRSLEPFGGDWKGGLDWVRRGPWGCSSFLVREEGGSLRAGRAVSGEGASHSFSELATLSESRLCQASGHAWLSR